MGIRVEESVLHDLLDVIVRQLRADFGQVISRLGELFVVVDGVSVDALHHQHMGGGVFPEKGGGSDEIDLLIELVEFFQIGGFGLEIHFLLSHQPHFVQNLVEIHQPPHRRIF